MYCVPSPWWPWWQVCQECTEFAPSASVWGKPRRWLHLWCWPCPGTCSDRRELKTERRHTVLTGVKCFIWPTNIFFVFSCFCPNISTVWADRTTPGFIATNPMKRAKPTVNKSASYCFTTCLPCIQADTSPRNSHKYVCRFNSMWSWDQFICSFGPFYSITWWYKKKKEIE